MKYGINMTWNDLQKDEGALALVRRVSRSAPHKATRPSCSRPNRWRRWTRR